MSRSKERWVSVKSDSAREMILLAREVDKHYKKMESVLRSGGNTKRFEKKLEKWKRVDALIKYIDKEMREALQKVGEI